MDTFECIMTKLDVREFGPQRVPEEIKSKVLEAARMSGTGLNTQHWRFLVVEERENMKTLARDSTSGQWASGASLAVVILTNPEHKFHLIDAGRATQDMQLAAWNYGIASGLFTGIRENEMRRDFNIPLSLKPTVVVCFGYPLKKLKGRKNRQPLEALVHLEKYRG